MGDIVLCLTTLAQILSSTFSKERIENFENCNVAFNHSGRCGVVERDFADWLFEIVLTAIP